MIDIKTLNTDFGIADQLHFIKGEGGFEQIHIDNDHAAAIISLYGGQVLSYQPKTADQPVLFLSEQALYQQGEVIRGGTPICWPWFSDEPQQANLPSHGVVRNQPWQLVSTHAHQDGSTSVILAIEDNEQSRVLWDHRFRLQLELRIGQTLSLTLTSHNLGKQPFAMSEALHTYFAVSNVNEIEIEGLDGLTYSDKCLNFAEQQQTGNVQIKAELDRVYQSVSQDVVLHDPNFNRKIRITSPTCNTCVIWNPWQALSDVAGQGYQHFVCIEAANVADDKIIVPAGESHTITAEYSVESI